jgi:hypothetical protein
MTCGEAKRYYGEHKRIVARDGDPVLRISGGVFEAELDKLVREEVIDPGLLSVSTKDEAQCQVWYRGQG